MPTFDNMASKGLRAISYQVTRNVKAGYKPSHTSETLIGYIVCCALLFFTIYRREILLIKQYFYLFIKCFEIVR